MDTTFYNCLDHLVGQLVASATAEQEVLGAIPGSGKVLLGFLSVMSQWQSRSLDPVYGNVGVSLSTPLPNP